MVLELHIWGPAFTLPSIDPQCLAIVAYLAQTVPKGQWVLVASSDEGLSDAHELPVLLDDTTAIAGFDNIISYLCKKAKKDWDLDNHLKNARDRADVVAFTSHLQSHALPLLDLSLYVSSENYTITTRPAYSQFLPLPTPYTIPPGRRALAKSRTSHLNLSALDLDHIDTSQLEKDKHASIIPERLRPAGKQTVTGLVKSKHSTARFRLDALVDNLCEPLAELLGEKRYFLSDHQVTSLDCMALGYLSLALIPKVPHSWLKERMKSRYPTLCAFVQRMVEEVFGGTVAVEAALSPSPSVPNTHDQGVSLPWQAPPQTTMIAKAATLISSLSEGLPFSQSRIITDTPSPKHRNTDIPAHSSSTSLLLPAAAVMATVAAAVGTYIVYPALVGSSKKEEERTLEDMGEAGSLLAGLDFGGLKADSNGSREGREGKVGVGPEVDVEVGVGVDG
ncbi:MAG: hypothetical protein Q9164_002083 [Protoblastenia rupestris]